MVFHSYVNVYQRVPTCDMLGTCRSLAIYCRRFLCITLVSGCWDTNGPLATESIGESQKKVVPPSDVWFKDV